MAPDTMCAQRFVLPSTHRKAWQSIPNKNGTPAIGSRVAVQWEPQRVGGASCGTFADLEYERVWAHGAYTANLAQPTAVSDHGLLKSNADNTLQGCVSVDLTWLTRVRSYLEQESAAWLPWAVSHLCAMAPVGGEPSITKNGLRGCCVLGVRRARHSHLV